MAEDKLVEKGETQNRSRGGGHGNRGDFEKPKNFKNSFVKLRKELSKYKIAIFIVLICSIFSAAFNVVGPKILGSAITKISTDLFSVGKVDILSLSKTCGILISIYLISLGFSVFSGILITKVSQNLGVDLRKRLSRKISALPLNYFDRNKTGNTISRITNDVDTITMSLNQSLPQVINSTVTFIGTIIMMFSINATLAMVCMVLIPISMVLAGLIIKKSQSYFKAQQSLIGKTNGYIEETFSGIEVIKSYNSEEKAEREFSEINNDLANAQRKATFVSSLMMPITDFLGNIGYVAVVIIGSFFAAAGKMSIGDISAYMQYVKRFMQPIVQISQATTVLQSTVAAAERIFEFLDEEDEVKAETTVDLSDIKGEVEFKNVHFGYTEDLEIIKNFSAKIENGRKIAIVGPTGAGKTTILKLLMRFYEINSGDIFIDDKNITNMSRGDLRSLFGIVLQDTWLLSDTIMENIKFGNENATKEDIVEACKMAHIHHHIKTLPKGYDTVLNEDSSNLSEGQKQLLTIARAIVSNPKILILDEATSNVDTRTEKQIQNATYNLMKNRTSFVIAHRLSTILDSDMILVMKDGDIVEKGNHEKLINDKGYYYDLYNSQFQKA
ncbi:MAG: ABC transporter ATP-binding protein [Lachnospirales bacterium]